MNRSARRTAPPLDDATSVAGWVFADLLLLLSIIFLTSISFALPSTGKGAAGSLNDSPGISTGISLDEGFTKTPLIEGYNFIYKKFDKTQLEADLAKYFKSEGLSPNTDVIYAQLVGGYTEGKEGSDSGTMAALKFSIELAKAKIAAFEDASIDLLTSSKIPSGIVALRLTFIPPIGE